LGRNGTQPGPADAPGVSALRARAAVLLARAVEAQGRAPEAEQLLRGLIDAPQTDAGSLPAIHLQLYRLLAAGGRVEEAERVRQLLVERFPRSPEAAAARPQAGGSAGHIVPAPTPADLFGFAEAPAAPAPAGEPEGDGNRPAPQGGGTSQAPAESSAAPSASPPKLALVQAGSFTVEENARYLVRDLQKLGYPARVLERELDGRRFYRVVVDPPGPVEAAQALLLMLKNAGYEGFLLFLD
jgi:cell division septation protein DedD